MCKVNLVNNSENEEEMNTINKEEIKAAPGFEGVPAFLYLN